MIWEVGENFPIDICKTNKRYRKLFYKDLSEYNGVQKEIKNVGRIQKFKEKLLEFVLSKRLSWWRGWFALSPSTTEIGLSILYNDMTFCIF